MNSFFSYPKSCGIIPLYIFFALFLFACAQPESHHIPIKTVEMVKLFPNQYPMFADDMVYDNLEYAVEKSLSYLRGKSADKSFAFGEDHYTAAHLITSLNLFLDYIRQTPSSQELNQFLVSNYLVYQSVGSDGKGRVLFTGYYEPFLQGRLEKDTIFKYPVYKRPSDLVVIDLSPFSPELKGKTIVGRIAGQHILPYHDRDQIEFNDVLENNADVLAWVKNPIDLFFLHIQGSGKIFTETAQPMNVHYHTSNGRPYRSIGKLLLDEGKILKEYMSMQSIREYLRYHPEDIQRVFSYNPSYVFFKKEEEGPKGYLDVKLTPGRSLALDRRIFPPGALMFIETRIPTIDGDGQIHEWSDFSRFVLNQDTGGAIRGPGRADLFWGNGPYAEIAAGHLQHPGKVYFLVLRPDKKFLSFRQETTDN